jgi:hypothetical protein
MPDEVIIRCYLYDSRTKAVVTSLVDCTLPLLNSGMSYYIKFSYKPGSN